MAPDERGAVLAFARGNNARCADVVEEWEHGTLLRTPSLGAVWSINSAYVERPAPDLTVDALDAFLAERFPDGRYASVSIEDEETAARLEPEARERGWRIEHELFMVLRREVDRAVDTSGVREATEDEVQALLSLWFAEDFGDQGRETLRELDEFARRQWRVRPRRAFVDDAAQATCSLWIEDGVVEVEDVYTVPEARGRGLVRALLAHALGVARSTGGTTFIVADDDDTPKDFYARLGFDPVTLMTRLVREAP